jgi:hypothetical protein
MELDGVSDWLREAIIVIESTLVNELQVARISSYN